MVCSTLETEARSEYAGGDFLPLSVYAARGFDTKRIEQFTPEHLKKEDEVLGMCYKVIIGGSKNSMDKAKTKKHELRGTKRPLEEEQPPPLALMDGSAGNSDSDSSTSSSEKKKKKKSKKVKKEKKDRKEKKTKDEQREASFSLTLVCKSFVLGGQPLELVEGQCFQNFKPKWFTVYACLIIAVIEFCGQPHSYSCEGSSHLSLDSSVSFRVAR